MHEVREEAEGEKIGAECEEEEGGKGRTAQDSCFRRNDRGGWDDGGRGCEADNSEYDEEPVVSQVEAEIVWQGVVKIESGEEWLQEVEAERVCE